MIPAAFQKLRVRQLKIIVAVAEHGSVLKASHALGITQPALTKTLREVEDVLGVKIFDRLPRGVIPNRHGELVLARIYRMLSELSALQEDLSESTHAVAGTISIGVLPTAAPGLLADSIACLSRIHPGLMLRVVQGRTKELLPALSTGDLEMIVGRLYGIPLPDVFLREPLYMEPISMIGRHDHPIFNVGQPTSADVTGYPIALPAAIDLLGHDVEAALASIDDMQFTASVRSTALSFIRELIYQTDTLAVFPRIMLSGDLARGALRIVPFPIKGPTRWGGLISLRHRVRTPTVEAFVSAIKETLHKMRAHEIVE